VEAYKSVYLSLTEPLEAGMTADKLIPQPTLRILDLPRRRSSMAFSIVVLAAFCLIYIAPLPVRPLYMVDETRYAEIPREMIATGDWVVPRLVGLRYFEKPVLGYWVTALSILSLGETRFALRLPSALAMGFSAMLLVLLLRRSGHTASALTGAIVFLTSLGVYTFGVSNILDGLFSAFVTATMVCFYLALLSRETRTKAAWLCASGVACGLGFLTKGALAFAIPTVAIVPFLIWEKRLKALYTLPWIPILSALAIVLPWAIMIHSREPDYWHHFIFVEHFKRFASTDSTSLHPKPFWFLLPYLIAGAVPWTFLAWPSAKGLRTIGRRDSFTRYALCWLLFPFLLLCTSQGKLGTYVAPCLAPLSLLLVLGLIHNPGMSRFRPLRRAGTICAGVLGLTAAVIAGFHLLNPASSTIFTSGETWKWIVGCAALAVASATYVLSARAKSMPMSLYLFAAAPVALMLCAHFIVPEKIVNSIAPEAFVERCAPFIDPADQIYSPSNLAPAVCWGLKRADITILERAGELQSGLNYPDAKHRKIRISQLARHLEDSTRTRNIVIMITDNSYSRYKHHLPEATRMERVDGFVFLKYMAPLKRFRKL
jgi:4-amino-4-deoxy-L-arabinose transferase